MALLCNLHPRPRFAIFVINGLPRILAAKGKKERPEAAQAKAPPAAEVGGPVRPFGSFWLFLENMPFGSFWLAISEPGWVARGGKCYLRSGLDQRDGAAPFLSAVEFRWAQENFPRAGVL